MFPKAVNILQSSSLINFAFLMSRYGVDSLYLARAVFILLLCSAELPFTIYEESIYGSRIESVEIRQDPIFIIGHWRSGTSHLQNILSNDVQFGTPTHLQVFYPKTFFTFENFRSLFEKFLPEERGFDNVKVGLDVPEEEEEALLAYSPYSVYNGVVFPRHANDVFLRYGLFENISADELEGWRRDYIWFLKKISLVYGERPLLLKNPVNTCRISMLSKIFPKARFIHIYRNPYEVFESTVNMIQIHTKKLRLQKLECLEKLQKNILQRYRLMMEAYDRQSILLPSDRLVEVSFEQVRDHPIDALNKIYSQLNLKSFEDVRPSFEQYISKQKKYRQNSYVYKSETLQLVSENWREWIDRWNYKAPSSLNNNVYDTETAA